ncbi:MAG TPA: hypothetical protein VKS60_06240 [Stellaceae bacterium]|nr:hypothetical protein [Stellaceae bacterium]
MGDTDDAVKQEWVARVLGVTFSQGKAPAANWDTVRAMWRQASDAADAQIAALQAALRKTDDDTLHEIAEFGMNGVTGNFKVPLMAALIELGAPGQGAKALKIVRDFRAYLDTDEKVLVCDENPFEVPVSLRATLGGALAQMEAALAKAA